MKITKQKIKKQVLKQLFWDAEVDAYYRKFSKGRPGYTKNHPVDALGYIIRLNYAQHSQKDLDEVIKPQKSSPYLKKSDAACYYYRDKNKRLSCDELYDKLKEYDVISFDIFDTLVFRKVEHPNDVFAIMALEMGYNDFQNIRKKAEEKARERKFREEGHREVVLDEIYQVLGELYGIDAKWEQREIELELDLTVRNPYMYEVYSRLQESGKTIVITSDMYLPQNVIEQILHKNGYDHYERLYLSNEYKLRKGDGTLQKKVKADHASRKIVHIGDSKRGDVLETQAAGLDAVYNKNQNLKFREFYLNGLAGSFYRAIINNTLNDGTWDQPLSFEHGFRVGGILAAGFCEYLNTLCEQKKIDKILFCARDCDVIWKLYNNYFHKIENEYIEISRYAIMNAASERYFYDLIDRFIVKYSEQNRTVKTIETIFKEMGYEYLTAYLEEDDIDKYLFPAALSKKKLEDFLIKHKDVMIAHNASCFCAAKTYFDKVIGDAKNVLVVDIGWSGTCITALKHFVEQELPEKECNISGALMCTSRGKALTASMSEGVIESYVYSPFSNMNLTSFMMPASVPAREQELLHMPLEYLFTSVQGSLISYVLEEDGTVAFHRTENVPKNKEEIVEMQRGMEAFVVKYKEYTDNYKQLYAISPYVAFMPLVEAIKRPFYSYEVYKNFLYDACTAPYADRSSAQKFGELYEIPEEATTVQEIGGGKKRILFVTPELTYTGTPRSLLRMCKVAVQLGYQPIVWSAKPGPFIREYEKNNIPVFIVAEQELKEKEIVKKIKSFDMAVCNTIAADQYAKKCSYYLPVVWYIREATNIPDFCRNNNERLLTLKHSKNLYCVSDYAADAIKEFTKQKVRVIHNSVEDETDMAVPYVPGSGEKIKFVQFGTMEYRKGYDVLVAAYQAMPEAYREQAELYFAGGFINSGAPYCSYLFDKMKDDKNIHYLGIVKGEENKIQTLSKMDVIVVASRDESCSLVALEGAMLSRPIIVTENVGAKYMVTGDNGVVAGTGDVETLKDALMRMIDHREELAEWGRLSRKNYEEMASMTSYTADMEKLFQLSEKKNNPLFKAKALNSRIVNSWFYRNGERCWGKLKELIKRRRREQVVVSLTSHPGRIDKVSITIESLLGQKSKPQKILLWLSKVQFPDGNAELPKELVKLTENPDFEIRWAEDDLAPHKKYLYTVQEYPDLPVIIVDDDVIYDPTLVERLMNSYRKFPDCVSCMRANFMMFRPDGTPRIYDKWIMDYKLLMDTPSYQLMPTGVGGVLYPPNALPEAAFQIDAIKKTCLYCDDLWLKMMVVYNNFRTVIPRDWCKYELIEGSQDTALWHHNVHRSNNDVSLENILNYFDETICKKDVLLGKIRQDRFC